MSDMRDKKSSEPSDQNQVLSEGSVWTMAHTTARVSSPEFVLTFVDILRRMFSEETMTVRWEDSSGQEEGEEFSSMSPQELDRVYARGGIRITDAGDTVFCAGISWNEVSRRGRRQFLRGLGYRQNEVFIRVHETLLANKEFSTTFVDACTRIAIEFSTTYLYVYDWRKQPTKFGGRDGLAVGIKDVYWLNIFGKPYIDLIGRDVLLGTPAHEVRELGGNHIVIRATDLYGDPLREPLRSARATARNHIGHEYFTKAPGKAEPEPPATGAFSVFNVVKLAKLYRHATREFLSRKQHADVCPTFDWSNILLDDSPGRSGPEQV